VTRASVRRSAVPALTAAACALAIVCGQAQGTPAAPGPGVIGTLTSQTREQALECGRRGPDCAIVPYQLCPDDQRYTAVLLTPFSRVALAAIDAEKNGRPLGRIGPASVNRWGVSIHVSPVTHAGNPEPIERIELRREGKVIQPTTTTVGPVTITSPSGAAKVSTRGVFNFSADVFEPSAALQLVLVGPSGESGCTLEKAHLRTLR
jgi:hypothetical protein